MPLVREATGHPVIGSEGEAGVPRCPKPVGRNSRPEEQAWPLIMLNSPRQSYTTATTLFTTATSAFPQRLSGRLGGSRDGEVQTMDAARPILDQINLVVNDMEAMAAFYERLGLKLQGGPPEWSSHHRSCKATAGLPLDLDSREFASVWNAGWPPDRTGAVIGFRLPSRQAVDAMFAELIADGYEGQQSPYDAFWGARYAVVEDPDGNSVGLMSPSDPSLATRAEAPPT